MTIFCFPDRKEVLNQDELCSTRLNQYRNAGLKAERLRFCKVTKQPTSTKDGICLEYESIIVLSGTNEVAIARQQFNDEDQRSNTNTRSPGVNSGEQVHSHARLRVYSSHQYDMRRNQGEGRHDRFDVPRKWLTTDAWC
jgi:hypothetical protein